MVHTESVKKRRIGLLVAWVVATLTATLLASQAVALVRDQVTDRPSRAATTLALETTTSTAVASSARTPRSVASASTSLAETTTTTLAEASSTTQAEVTTTPVTTTPVTTTPVTTTSVTTTSVPAPTSTTTTVTTNQEETFYLTGGWATARCAGNGVGLATYAPNAGYHIEIESAGPNMVEIKFEESGGKHESKLIVKCDNGVLDPKIEEKDDD